MNYEIVNLEEKTVVGLSARTNNFSPDIQKVIGTLWSDFYGKGVYEKITDKANYKALGIYSDYENDEKGDYTVTVGCQVTNADKIPENTVRLTVPKGKYAKFIVKGHMQRAVSDFWQELWKIDLTRSYVCDFEEYQNSDMENAEIHIYIGLK